MADPQLAHRQAFGEVRDAAGGFRALNPPFRFSAATAPALRPRPRRVVPRAAASRPWCPGATGGDTVQVEKDVTAAQEGLFAERRRR